MPARSTASRTAVSKSLETASLTLGFVGFVGVSSALRRFVWTALLAAGLVVGMPSMGANAAAGRIKAQQCAACHGPVGLSATPDAPNLAGQPEIYLAAQLRAYRSGERRHEVMTILAKPLTDDDIANLAAWFSSIRVEAQAPR